MEFISSEKKLVKSLKNCFYGTNLHRKGIIMGQAQNKKLFFFQKKQKQIISFQKFFILSKYQMFWLSYESFSILSDVFVKKSVIST